MTGLRTRISEVIGKIDWGTLLLFGGGITLGNLMFSTKLAEVIGTGLFSSAVQLPSGVLR